MYMFKKKEVIPAFEYDPEKQRAVLKCSICNGEQVAGFKDRQTGHFTDVMLIKNDRDLDRFMELYNVAAITKEY